MPDILSVNNLKTVYIGDDGTTTTAVNNVSFKLDKGELLGITGESGSGKTSILMSIANLLPLNGRAISGTFVYNERNFSAEKGIPRSFLGREIGFVFQDPLAALNPVYTIGFHLLETLMINLKVDRHSAKAMSLTLLKAVNLKDPRQCYKMYPHQLSGGMRQRVMLALALSCHPKIVLADEPTSSLDILNAKEILKLFKDLKNKMDFSVIIVSHDIDLLLKNCDRILILNQGSIIADGPPLYLKLKKDLNEKADKLLNYEKYYYGRR